jgi:hypothetical protein
VIVNDPDIFHAEAKLIVASRHAQDVLLYIKENRFYQALPCCGILSNIEDVTGTVTILDHTGRYAVKVHNINLGLRVRVSHWFGLFDRIYDTPDAVELVRRLNPTVLEGTTIVPTREPPPNSGGGRRVGGGCGCGSGGCHTL